MATSESEALLNRALDFLQRDRRVRTGLGALLLAGMLALAGRSAFQLLPTHYTLTLSGGNIVSNRHQLARILQREAAKHDLTLVVQPTATSMEALERVTAGTLDLALIQGGVETPFPKVEQVSTVEKELVHLLVKPGLKDMDDLRGKSINLGTKASAARQVALTLTRFAGYQENVDFVETNYSPEQLLALPLHKMPDAIINISTVPSYLVELLVRRFHYELIEIPFPEALALRHGWAGSGTIRAYTYNLTPPVPAKDLRTVAVNMLLVGSAQANPDAIARLLEVLYSPAVSSRLAQPLDPAGLTAPTRYRLSDGTTHYLHRNDSVFTVDMWKQVQNLFGLVMSFAGMGLVVLKWFKGKPPAPTYDDAAFLQWLGEAVKLEKEAVEMERAGVLDRDRLRALNLALADVHLALLERAPGAVLKDAGLPDRCGGVVAGAIGRVDRLARSGLL